MIAAVPELAFPELAFPEAGRLDERIRADVRREGAVVVRGVDVASDEALLAVASSLGEPSATENGIGDIHDVAPRAIARDVSQTAERFPLHTDSTFLAEPHDFVVLGCQEARLDGGGESRVMHVDALRTRIGARDGGDVLEALGEPAFWFLAREPGEKATRARALPVLECGGQDDWKVRYRGDALARGARAAGVKLTTRHRSALEALERALSDHELHARYALRPGDVLLLDNRRVLHGRTAIRPGVRRLLRRVKVVAR